MEPKLDSFLCMCGGWGYTRADISPCGKFAPELTLPRGKI